MTVHVFGLTGGIGSGKSTVAERLRALGVPVMSADELAHQATAAGTPALAAIAATFGANMIADSGALDRARLADVVFRDATARERLNAIVHPEVARLKEVLLLRLKAEGHQLIGYDVPLLFEVGLAEQLRPVVVVSALPEQQVERARRRDSQPPEKIEARIRAQWPIERKTALADYVIDNSGSLRATVAATDALVGTLCARFGIERKRYPPP